MKKGLLFLLFMICVNGYSQVTVSATLDSTHAVIGDQLKMHLKVDDLAASMRDLETTLLDSTKGLEIIAKGVWEQINDRGATYWQRDLTLTAWDTGHYMLPSIGVGFLKRGQTGRAFTRTLPLTVSYPVGVDTLKTLLPIKDIVREDMKWDDALPYVFGILGLAALGLLGTWLYRKWKNKEKAPVKQVVQLPPHVLAAQKLKALKESPLLAEGKVNEYNTELSYIVREYLEGRYQIPALESVTDDLMRDVQRLGFDDVQVDHLEELLHTSDLAKFANVVPPKEVHERMMGFAEGLVEATKPVLEVKEGGGEVEVVRKG